MRLNIQTKISLLVLASLVVYFLLISFIPYFNTKSFFSIFALILMISILAGWVGAWLFVPAIKEIISATEKLGRADFSRRVNFPNNDELRDLSRALNQMSEEIKLRIDEAIASKSRLEAVFLSMFEGVMVVNAQGNILLMNHALKEFLSVTQNPEGHKPLEIIRNIEIQEITDNVLKLQSGVESRELTLILPEEKILLVHATPIIREGKSDGAVLVFHDITKLRRLEKIRQDFVANVSHELRTPVSTIKGYAETLLEGALEDKENARDFVQIIYSDSDRLAKLVNDLLDLSKIESGKVEFTFTNASLERIVDRVLPLQQKLAQQKSISLKKDIPLALPEVKVDEMSIAQVFLNLIENAIKYNRPKGKVVVSARDNGSNVLVTVSDTGIGVPKDDISRIFERFYRVDKAHSRQLGGTGLGLSIVKHLVQAHEGEVWVESELDQGSTFYFTLPKA